MNPVDNNINVRSSRGEASDTDQVDKRRDVAGASQARDAATTGSAAAGETVSFTRTAADLLSLENQLRELPGIDRERVDSIREAISNGSYEVDPARIVDNLLLSDRELG